MNFRYISAGLAVFALFCNATALGDGIFTVPKSAPQIRVDGNIEESEGWNRAVRLTNFQLISKTGFANEQTAVWITHDSTNLYIAMKMQTQVLLQASNMRARFQANVKHGDTEKKIWDDDSIEVRLRPPWSKKISADSQFWMIVNANGACDSFAPKGSTQDWYKQGQIKTSIGEGFWAVEMAFPLKIFGGDKMTGQEMANWGINFIRFEKNRNENSSFANISGKSHLDTSLYALMTLALDDELPAIRMPDIISGNISNVEVDYYAAKRIVGSWWTSSNSIQNPSKRFETNGLAIFAQNGKAVQVKPEYKGTGTYKWFFYFVYGRPLQMIFRSPAYPASADQGPVQLQLKRPETVKNLTFNRQTLQAQNKNEFYPQAGENTLQITSGMRLLLLKLSYASTLDLPLLNWRYFNGKNWQSAKVENQDGWLAVSAPAGQPEYRFATSFSSNMSVMEWTGESNDFNLNANGTGYFFWCPNRSGSKLIKPDSEVSLTLILPSWLKVAGAASYQMDSSVPLWQNKPEFENHYRLTAGTTLKLDGQDYRFYTITSKEIGKRIPEWDIEEIRVYLRTRCLIVLQADASAAGKTGKVGYYMVVNGEPEIPVFRDVACLPELNGIQPRNIRFSMYMNQFSRCNNADMMAAQLKTFKAAGGTEAFVDNVYCVPNAEIGISLAYFFHLRGGNAAQEIDMRRIFAKYPQARGWSTFANLAALNRIPEVWQMMDAEFAAIRKRAPHAKNLLFDYEFPPFMHYSDVSPYTLKIFADEFKITEQPLNEKVIKEKYLKQWVDFRCRELARVIPKLRLLANKHGFEFTMYGAPDPRWKDRYSFDWQMIADQGGVDMVYFGGDWDHNITRNYLQSAEKSKTPVCTSIHVCMTDNTGWKRGLILRRLLLSRGGGIFFWYEKGFDGIMLQEIAAVSRLAAEYEDFFRRGVLRAFGTDKGKVVYSANNPTPEIIQKRLLGDVDSKLAGLVVSEWNGKFLAMAINDTAVPVNVTLKMDRAADEFRDTETGKSYPADKDLMLKIPPYGYYAFTGKIR